MFRDLKEIQNIGVQPKFSRITRLRPSQPANRPSAAGYTITPSAEGGFLPPVNLNLQEALGLLLLVHKMRGQIQLPFKNAALLAALKIESSLPPRIRHYCDHALARITTKPGAQAPPPGTPGLDNIFSTLQNAAAQRRKVHVHYDSLFDGKVIDCELSPYHLFYNQRAWYVVGRSSMHKTIRTFKLNRIKEAQMLEEKFRDGDDFDMTEHIGRAWSMIPEGRIYDVRLRFTPKVANNVAEVQWHETQKVLRNDDGSTTLNFRVDGLGEITWWILGYGDQVEVLAPVALRNRIAEIARGMIKINTL
jgi:proteasome accessory factor B